MADVASPTLDNPPTVSALELHEIMVRSHATANLGRKRLADGLRVLDDSDLARHLGFPHVYAYSEATFHYGHTQTHELILVSRRLLSLPLLSRAYERGELTWRLTASLSAVATAESEAEWLQFLEGRRGAFLRGGRKTFPRIGRDTRPPLSSAPARRRGWGMVECAQQLRGAPQ